MLLLTLPRSTHVYFTCGSLSIWTVFGFEILVRINHFVLVSSRAFRDKPHSRFRCGNPNQCSPSFFKVYRFGQCFGEKFSPISTFFSLVSSRAFRDALNWWFWCRDLKLCLLDLLKMPDLALSQIYTRVVYSWKSVALDNAWVRDSRPFIFFLLRVLVACFL